jgi:hypothetical protein
MDDLAPMARLLDALRPWLRHLVIAGGWAHRLHRFHPLANPPAYRLGNDDQGFYVEFLAPLRGDGLRRDGSPDATVARAGITAQKLRYVDVLLAHPWIVGLGENLGIALPVPLEARIANPVSFIVQKLLIRGRRPPVKRAQDTLYIHDTLELFGARLEVLRTVWREQVRPSLPATTARSVERLHRDRFGTVTDAIRAAAAMPQNRVLTAERVRAACAYGCEAVFGTE